MSRPLGPGGQTKAICKLSSKDKHIGNIKKGMRRVLAALLYHLDPTSQLRKHKDATTFNNKRMQEQQQPDDRHRRGRQDQRQSLEKMLANEWWNHLQSALEPGQIVQIPADANVYLEQMHTYLGAVRRGGADDHVADGGDCGDYDMVADADATTKVAGLSVQAGFFKVVHSSPGSQKVLRRRAGAGQTLVKGDIILSHVGMVEENEERFVPTFATASTLSVIIGMREAFSDLQEHGAMVWDAQQALLYWLPDLCDPETQAALGDFVRNGAYGDDSAMVVSPHDSGRQNALSEMRKRGFVAEATARKGSWFLTDLGLSPLQLVHRIVNPKPVCEPAGGFEQKAISDMSNFEILVFLQRHGWQWRPLPIKSKRHGCALHLASADIKRIFYGGFKRSYMSVMASCERDPKKFLDAGHTFVLHFQSESYYECILTGRRPVLVDGDVDIDGPTLRPDLDEEELIALLEEQLACDLEPEQEGEFGEPHPNFDDGASLQEPQPPEQVGVPAHAARGSARGGAA